MLVKCSYVRRYLYDFTNVDDPNYCGLRMRNDATELVIGKKTTKDETEFMVGGREFTAS